jgi:hypothetical protein
MTLLEEMKHKERIDRRSFFPDKTPEFIGEKDVRWLLMDKRCCACNAQR